MNISLTHPDFLLLCERIIAKNICLDQWMEIPSSDMFQKGSYVGGFDDNEQEFTFSYYIGKDEYWFQVSLEDIERIRSGEITEIEARPADK
mgnify:CR=1 FL=1